MVRVRGGPEGAGRASMTLDRKELIRKIGKRFRKRIPIDLRDLDEGRVRSPRIPGTVEIRVPLSRVDWKAAEKMLASDMEEALGLWPEALTFVAGEGRMANEMIVRCMRYQAEQVMEKERRKP